MKKVEIDCIVPEWTFSGHKIPRFSKLEFSPTESTGMGESSGIAKSFVFRFFAGQDKDKKIFANYEAEIQVCATPPCA